MTFYDNIENGQNITTSPRWIGVKGIKGKIAETATAIDSISSNSKKAFTDDSWTKTEPDNFRNNLTNMYNTFKGKTLTNYNPSKNKQANFFVPTYISTLGSYQTENTILYGINEEFNVRIQASIKGIDEAKKYSKDIDKYAGEIKKALNSVNQQLTPLENAFTTINKDVINPWGDAVSHLFFNVFI